MYILIIFVEPRKPKSNLELSSVLGRKLNTMDNYRMVGALYCNVG